MGESEMTAKDTTRVETGGHGTEILQRPGAMRSGDIGARPAFPDRDPGGSGNHGVGDRRPPAGATPRDRTLLIVDDDTPFRTRLARIMESRGFDCEVASSVAEGVIAVKRRPPSYALLDLRLEDGSGLDIAKAIHARGHPTKVVMLTGYGNIATAVAAVKTGAVDYLAKPADANAIEAALLAEGDLPPPPEQPMSADRVRWEHIQRVYEQCERNVSETARRLNMHRRTLQRILAKRAPLEKAT
jgi:two-component system response regulator RegA